MAAGIVLAVLGVVIAIGAFATTHVTLVPGTLQTVETQGVPGPGAWLIMVAGIVLAVLGYARRNR